MLNLNTDETFCVYSNLYVSFLYKISYYACVLQTTYDLAASEGKYYSLVSQKHCSQAGVANRKLTNG